jgi:hypothetical protein
MVYKRKSPYREEQVTRMAEKSPCVRLNAWGIVEWNSRGKQQWRWLKTYNQSVTAIGAGNRN